MTALNSIRIIPRDSEFLNRKLGSRGEIFYDRDANTLRLYNGQLQGGISLAKSNLTNVSNSDFLAKANSAGFSGGVQAGVAGRLAYYPATGSQVNDLEEVYWHTHDGASMLHITGELEVSGQKNRIRFHWDSLADLTSQVPAADWHGMVAHAHDTGKLYYAHAGAWVAVASETSLPTSFSTIAVAGQSNVVADSITDADPEYNNGAIINVVGDGSDFFKREVTVNGVRVMGAGTVGGQTAVPDAWLEKVARMFELFTDPTGAGINEASQRTFIKTLSGDAGTYHAAVGPTLQRVARGAGADYTPNFLTDQGVIDWNLTPLFDTHVANDMVWYLNSTGAAPGDGDNDAQEVIEHVFHTLHMHGLDAVSLKMYSYITADWASGPLYAAMEEAYDAGKWDSSGYGGNAWKTDGDAFEVAAKEYLFLLNFGMFEYSSLWDGGSLSPEWTDDMRTQSGIQANNPLGYALHNTYIAPVISKPSLTTIRSIFQDGDVGDPTVAGASGYIVDVVVVGSPTLTLAAGSNITITTDADTDTVTINSTTSTGSITFVGTTIDSADSSTITFTPAVAFDSDVIVGNAIVFPDGTYQQTSAVGVPGPQGEQGPQGASGAGTGDVLSSGGGYVDNAIIRYDGITGTIIQNSSATISDAGLLTATDFSGGGAALTALNATQLTSGTVPDARFPATLPAASGVNLTALNATNLGSGTVPDARFPATLPAASGVNLTALNATNLGSGTVPIGRLGASGTPSASTYLRGDNTWATVAGGGAASDSFATIIVAGQSSVVADSATDTLTLVAGSGITITTDASTDTVTITNSGSASNSFSTVAVTGHSNVAADSAADTLTLAGGTGISITTDAGTDTVTITSTVSAGATAFTDLTDYAGLTVDRFYLPAITMLDVTANGITAYRFDQYGTTDDPTIYAINATTIAFNLAGASGHPFLIQENTGTNYNTGLVHVTTSGVVTTGAAAQGMSSGTLYWKIPDSISGNYRYQCASHAGMVGTITVKNFATI